MRKRVLVTCVGSTNALSIVKALRAQERYEVEAFGVDCEEGRWTAGAAFCDGFRLVPPVRPGEAYVAALAGLVDELGIDLVFPILDEEVALLGRYRETFPPGVLQLSPQASLELGVDKLAAYEFLRAGGFDTPRTAAASAWEANGAEDLGWPLIAKPRRGFSSRDVLVVGSPAELEAVLRAGRVEEPLLQERAEGEELTVDLFGDGERVLAAVPRVRLMTKEGQVYKARTDADPRVIAEARRLGEALRLRGPANVQGFRTAEGRFLFTDLNLRVSGGLPLTTAAGVNLPLLGLSLADDARLEPVAAFAPLTMCRYWEEVFRRPDSESSRREA